MALQTLQTLLDAGQLAASEPRWLLSPAVERQPTLDPRGLLGEATMMVVVFKAA